MNEDGNVFISADFLLIGIIRGVSVPFQLTTDTLPAKDY